MTDSTLKGKTAKGLFWGGLGNGIQQLLGLVFGIFIARILNANDYGMVGMLTIFSVLATNIQECGFANAIANKQVVKHEDYNAVFWFSLITGLTLYVILFFCAPFIADFYHKPELVPLARYLFLSFVFSSSVTAHNALLFRNMKVKEKTISQVAGVLVSGIVGVAMAFNGMAYWGLATQTVVYVFIYAVCMWHFSPWRPTIHFNFRPLKEMLIFSSKILATNIFIQINNNIFSVILGRYFTPVNVGYYTQASKWDNMGISVVDAMIRGVAQPVFTETADELDRLRHIFHKMLRFTAFIVFPCMLGLALIAKEVIVITITAKWLQAVPIMQLLCVWGAFVPITSLFTNFIISRGKSNIYMWNTIALGVLQVISLVLMRPYGIMYMVLLFVIINIIWLLVWYFFLWKEIHITLWSVVKDIAPYAVIATFTMLLTAFITHAIGNIYMLFIAKLLIAAFIYVFLMWICRSVVFKESIKFIFKREI